MNTKLKVRRSLEREAASRMRLFANWLEFWEEDVKSEDHDPRLINSSFGLLQLRDLQKVLTKVEARLEEFEGQN